MVPPDPRREIKRKTYNISVGEENNLQTSFDTTDEAYSLGRQILKQTYIELGLQVLQREQQRKKKIQYNSGNTVRQSIQIIMVLCSATQHHV